MAGLDSFFELINYAFEFQVRLLIGNRSKSIWQADTGTNHNRKLIGKAKNIFCTGTKFHTEITQTLQEIGFIAGIGDL